MPFHIRCGGNVELSPDRNKATRRDLSSSDGAIVFSAHPLIDAHFRVRIEEGSKRFPGDLRVGVIKDDPAQVANLSSSSWASLVREYQVTQVDIGKVLRDDMVCVSLDADGRVFGEVNEQTTARVEITGSPLWVVIDIGKRNQLSSVS